MKGLETLQDLVFDVKTNKKYQEAYYLVLKQVKALEIIKNIIKFDFRYDYFGIKDNYHIVVNNDLFGAIRVDKEQFDLLKEVLCLKI